MSLPILTRMNWWLGIPLEVGILCLAVRRGLAKRLPFFVGYLSLLVANEIVMFGIYRIDGVNSKTYLYAYWVLQAFCISLRATVVYEICRSILSPYAGIWRTVDRLLLAIAVVLLAAGVMSARTGPYHFTNAVLTGERGLELIVVTLLVVGLAFCRYYGVRVEHHLAWIALGLGFYSVVQVADNTFLQHWSSHWLSHFAIWEGLRHFSWDIALMMWGIALWRPLPVLRPAPALLNRSAYEDLSPLVTARLRELNTRLLEMWK